MTPTTQARNQDDLIDIINQALDEVEDLRAAIEYDEAYLGEPSIIVEPVSNGLSRLLMAVKDDEYQPGQGDWLDFLSTIRDIDHRVLPFWPLLKIILSTHEMGYQQEPGNR